MPIHQLLQNRIFLTDGGLETDIIFNEGIDLPHFASIALIGSNKGRAALERYYKRYVAIARENGFGFILESPTWRSSPDWGDRLGMSKAELKAANAAAISMMIDLRNRHTTPGFPMLVSGCVGPRGDGYVAGEIMRPDVAEAYHDEQIGAMAAAGAELISAITMTNASEAIGIARAAARRKLPSVISFTVETDGRLPDGQGLGDAISDVDAATGDGPAYYMINCAHPAHFEHVLDHGASWTERIMGIRANASQCSHEELNEATELDRGDPADLGSRYRALHDQFPRLRVFGGCCGTDHEHLAAIAKAIEKEPAA
jgi:homocysteine S-methyltransferase